MTTKRDTKRDLIPAKEVFRKRGEMTFAKAIRAWREGEDWSQVEMAKRLGISRANLCDFEKGRKLPAPGRACQIARKIRMVEAYVVELVLQDILRREKVPFTVSVRGL